MLGRMAGRTFAIGDIHGELRHLVALLSALPPLDAKDTLVFLGDYVDRGPQSAQVVELVRRLPNETPARVVTLRGSHEDAWVRVRRAGWPEFILPVGNGCLATLRSYQGGPAPSSQEIGSSGEFKAMLRAEFFPADVMAWMEALPCYYEDEHAIYVHAGLPKIGDRWAHPSELQDPKPLLWQRTEEFFRSYQGKRIVFGHTITEALPQELSLFTPPDSKDLYATNCLFGIDTGCGHKGFLTAVELPEMHVYESRRALRPEPA
jgi:serine/threonine protein phosphatase 1